MSEMILLLAYVRPARRTTVENALRELELKGWSESSVLGFGQAAAGHGVEHTRFEVVVPATQAAEVAATITQAAHTGQTGDGIILSLPVLGLGRISDATVGTQALG